MAYAGAPSAAAVAAGKARMAPFAFEFPERNDRGGAKSATDACALYQAFCVLYDRLTKHVVWVMREVSVGQDPTPHARLLLNKYARYAEEALMYLLERGVDPATRDLRTWKIQPLPLGSTATVQQECEEENARLAAALQGWQEMRAQLDALGLTPHFNDDISPPDTPPAAVAPAGISSAGSTAVRASPAGLSVARTGSNSSSDSSSSAAGGFPAAPGGSKAGLSYHWGMSGAEAHRACIADRTMVNAVFKDVCFGCNQMLEAVRCGRDGVEEAHRLAAAEARFAALRNTLLRRALAMDARMEQAAAQAKVDRAARRELEGCRLVRTKLERQIGAMRAQLAAHNLLSASSGLTALTSWLGLGGSSGSSPPASAPAPPPASSPLGSSGITTPSRTSSGALSLARSSNSSDSSSSDSRAAGLVSSWASSAGAWLLGDGSASPAEDGSGDGGNDSSWSLLGDEVYVVAAAPAATPCAAAAADAPGADSSNTWALPAVTGLTSWLSSGSSSPSSPAPSAPSTPPAVSAGTPAVTVSPLDGSSPASPALVCAPQHVQATRDSELQGSGISTPSHASSGALSPVRSSDSSGSIGSLVSGWACGRGAWLLGDGGATPAEDGSVNGGDNSSWSLLGDDVYVVVAAPAATPCAAAAADAAGAGDDDNSSDVLGALAGWLQGAVSGSWW